MSAQVGLQVSDLAIAKIVAQLAGSTAGVIRLQPNPGRLVTRAAADLVQRAAGSATGRAPAAPVENGHDSVGIERVEATGTLTVTVRLIATTDPPVLQTAEAVQRRVAGELMALTGISAEVRVQVIDVEPTPG